MKRVKNIPNELNEELDLLEKEIKQNALTTNIKKIAFIEDMKQDFGKQIVEQIHNPNRHNPKKQTFWQKLKKALGC
jgi:trans-2-enoyl-CoA reductase